MFSKKTGLMLLGSVLGSELVWIVFQKVRTMCASSSATQVIFLPDDSVTTFPPGRGQEVSSSSGVGRLVAALREVRHSLDLAVFLITCRQLADEVGSWSTRCVQSVRYRWCCATRGGWLSGSSQSTPTLEWRAARY